MAHTDKQFFKVLMHRSLLTREGEVELARQVKRGGQEGREARRMLVELNQGLVIDVAKQYRDRGLSLADLVQEGNLGLLRAVDRFDYRLGFRFSTYAVWWIRQLVTRALTDKVRTIRLPVHVADAKRKVDAVRNRLRSMEGDVDENEELAEHLGISTDKVQRLLDVTPDAISLDVPQRGAEDRVVGDQVADDATPSPFDVLISRELSLRTLRALGKLKDRERRMIRMRFGIGTRRPYTLEEIGDKFGLSRERVRQIESRAMEKLRESDDGGLLESLLEQ